MEDLLNENEPEKVNYIGYIIGAVVGLIIIGAIVFIATRTPPMQEQEASVLEGAYLEGSPEFEEITKDIIISNTDKTIEGQNAFGGISMNIVGKVKNKGEKAIDGLEVNVAVVDQFGQPIKEKRVLVVPKQQPQLGAGETIPITLAMDGFTKDDDRANIRWKVTAIRTPK